MFDEGTGPAVIVIPGVQGRWEWFAPALHELKKTCRTISYTLCGDFGAGMRYDRALGFDNYMRQLDAVFERAGLERAALCGISYGGLIAVRYAAARPDRVTALIIASSPAPGWVPTARQSKYIARPWRSVPAFVATAPARLFAEIRTAHDTWRGRLRFAVAHGARALVYPMIPSVMAERVVLQQGMDFEPDCGTVRAPTLVLTGEESLDRIVPVAITRRYEALIPGARYEKLERTGHLGVLTRPKLFAKFVAEFVARGDHRCQPSQT